MATRITYIRPDPRDLDNRIAEIGSLFGWTEWKKQAIGEIEDGATYSAEADDDRVAVSCCLKTGGRPQLPDHRPRSHRHQHLHYYRVPHNPCSTSVNSRSLPLITGEHSFVSITAQNLPLRHPPMALLEQTVVVPFPGRTAANGASRLSLAGRRHSSNRSGHGPWRSLFCLHGPPRRRSRPRAPMGPSQPRRPGPLYFHDH